MGGWCVVWCGVVVLNVLGLCWDRRMLQWHESEAAALGVHAVCADMQ